MNAYKVTIAELQDLAEITLTWGNIGCKAKIIVSVTAPIPESCSACSKQFDQALKNALAAFVRFYREATNSGAKIEFAIREKI